MTATAVEILEAMADRGAIEQTNKDVQEVWGGRAAAGAQPGQRGQPRVYGEPRRPSHRDKRKALQREVSRGESTEALTGTPDKEEIRALAERLLELAA